jgi:hypothetical protein
MPRPVLSNAQLSDSRGRPQGTARYLCAVSRLPTAATHATCVSTFTVRKIDFSDARTLDRECVRRFVLLVPERGNNT